MDLNTIKEIFQRFYINNPTPVTELNYSSNFELLIAVILSAQATDIAVNKITKKLFKIANTPEKILALGTLKLQQHIKSIGLFRVKAINIIKTCNILIEQFAAQVPDNRVDLESLPGVGRKTANVILNIAFNQPVIAVDRHIFRVANRIGLTNAKNTLVTESQLLAIIPKKYILHAHHWLILHGRYTCLARKPKCNNCIINDLCESSLASFNNT